MSVTDIPATMRASVLVSRNTIELQERPVPQPAPGEVLIRVRSVGVCGSDVHYFREGRIGSMVVESPMTLGHEVSGVIAAVGDAVADSRIGQRVAVDPQRPCRQCRFCKTGNLNLCRSLEFYATPPVDGAFADYVTAPADFVYPLPDTLSDHAGALLEPFSVGLWACGKASIEPGGTVLISGAGPIGAMAAQSARAYGATEVIVTDLVESRRARILDFGATTALDPRGQDYEPSALDVDAFIECSGAEAALLDGLQALRPAGTAVMVGLGPEHMTLPVQEIMTKELLVTGIFRYVNTWPQVMAYAQQPSVDLDSMVTAEYDLDHVEQALSSDDDPASMKSVVVVSRGDE